MTTAELSAAQRGEARRQHLPSMWEPSGMSPLGVELTSEQALACAFRHLAGIGFSEHMAGHITWAMEGNDRFLVSPWGLWWSELSASDICTVDGEGRVVAGKWDVTNAIHIHTEIHRQRPDAKVVVHNHPYYVTVLAAVGLLRQLLHQTTCMYADEMCFDDEYDGEITDPSSGDSLATQIGTAMVVVLANHGVIVTAETFEEAVYKSANFERACRLTYEVSLLGASPPSYRSRSTGACRRHCWSARSCRPGTGPSAGCSRSLPKSSDRRRDDHHQAKDGV